MQIENLSARAKQVLGAMLSGHAVLHGQHGFTRGSPVRRSGSIDLECETVEVSKATMLEIEQAGVPLLTYEHNISEGWKTCVVYSQRQTVLEAFNCASPCQLKEEQ